MNIKKYFKFSFHKNILGLPFYFYRSSLFEFFDETLRVYELGFFFWSFVLKHRRKR